MCVRRKCRDTHGHWTNSWCSTTRGTIHMPSWMTCRILMHPDVRAENVKCPSAHPRNLLRNHVLHPCVPAQKVSPTLVQGGLVALWRSVMSILTLRRLSTTLAPLHSIHRHGDQLLQFCLVCHTTEARAQHINTSVPFRLRSDSETVTRGGFMRACAKMMRVSNLLKGNLAGVKYVGGYQGFPTSASAGAHTDSPTTMKRPTCGSKH